MENAGTRDRLALERTRLANERTFLAYIRTALSLLAGAAVIFQFFAEGASYTGAAWVLLLLGAMTLVVGFIRFFIVRRRLRGPESR